MEVKHRLLNFKDMYIYQDDDWFNFSLDSVILTNFVNFRKDDKKLLDMCTGNAPIPMMLAVYNDISIVGVEIQKEIYNLAIKSVKENKLNDKITILNDDIINLPKKFNSGTFDIITCNPPYFKTNDSSYTNKDEIKRIARHEIKINLDKIFEISRYLLKSNGRIFLVHRPERLCEIILVMKKHGFEAKKVMFVHSRPESAANMVLIEASVNGSHGLKVLPPMFTHNKDNTYTEVVRKMFD